MTVPSSPDFDAKQVIGLPVPEATDLLRAKGFTMLQVIDADSQVAMTADSVPQRRRLFQRDGIVVGVMG